MSVLKEVSKKVGVMGYCCRLFLFVFAGSNPLLVQAISPVSEKPPERYEYLYQLALSPEDKAEIRSNLPFEKIVLERTGCYGGCPMFKLTFHRDGDAIYEGRGGTSMEGLHTGNIGIRWFGRLSYAVEALHFSELGDEYNAEWTDTETIIIEVYAADGSLYKRVLDYGYQAPPAFSLLRHTIEAYSGYVMWEKH